VFWVHDVEDVGVGEFIEDAEVVCVHPCVDPIVIVFARRITFYKYLQISTFLNALEQRASRNFNKIEGSGTYQSQL
jgi:hypothetical protein